MAAPLHALIDLITDRTLSAGEVEQLVVAVEGKARELALKMGAIPEDEAAARAEELDAVIRDVLGFSLTLELFDYFAVSDKIDELHLALGDQLADPLPSFPHAIGAGYAGVNKKTTAGDYYAWLAPILKEYGDYELLIFGSMWDESLYGLIVGCNDAPRILELADTLAIDAQRAVAL